MAGTMTETDIATCDDVDELWAAFVTARRNGDDDHAELLRTRMAQLQEQRSIQELDDDQLLARIEGLKRQEDEADAAGIDLNNSPPGPILRLTALLDEAARREL
jgi:hypothetical protein